MADAAGTLRKVTLDGITFDPAEDVNMTEIVGRYENSIISTSGRNVLKRMRRSQNREGLTLICNGEELEILKELSERVDPFPMSYETAGADVYRSQGWINLENRETEENRVTIQLLPQNNNWDAFIA